MTKRLATNSEETVGARGRLDSASAEMAGATPRRRAAARRLRRRRPRGQPRRLSCRLRCRTRMAARASQIVASPTTSTIVARWQGVGAASGRTTDAHARMGASTRNRATSAGPPPHRQRRLLSAPQPSHLHCRRTTPACACLT